MIRWTGRKRREEVVACSETGDVGGGELVVADGEEE